MKKIFTIALSFFLLIPFSKSQIVTDYTLIGEYTIPELEAVLDDFGVPPGLFEIYNEIEVYKVTYTTANAQGTGTTTATGACAFPKGSLCGLSIAAYAHGTTSVKTGVPSYGSDELNIGMLWAGRGYATALPDYLGLGDSPGLHPYVHAKSEATATVDMIRATKEVGADLGYAFKEGLFLFGYSQGGHAAMAAFKEIQENHADEMVVTACIGMSGPYDVAGVQTDFINSGADYATPGYLPYVFLGYQEVYGNLYENSISEVLISPYDVNIPPMFDGVTSLGTINQACTPNPVDMIVPSYQEDFETNPDNPFRIAVEDNTLIHWTPMSPVRMYYCTEDEQVYYRNSEVARDSFIARGAPDVHTKNFGPYDHGGCLQYCLFNALFSMDSFETDIHYLLDYAIAYEESAAGAMDGSIVLTGNMDAGNLSYIWDTGETTSSLTGISGGEHTVTITGENGCEEIHEINFDQLLSNGNPKAQELEFYPNPAKSNIVLELPVFAHYNLDIVDVSGRLMSQTSFRAEGNYEVDLSEFQAGMYFIQLTNDATGETFTGKLMKN